MNPKILSLATEGELCKVTLEVVITPHGPVIAHYQEFLIFRPPKTLDRSLVPVNTLQQLASATIYLNAGL